MGYTIRHLGRDPNALESVWSHGWTSPFCCQASRRREYDCGLPGVLNLPQNRLQDLYGQMKAMLVNFLTYIGNNRLQWLGKAIFLSQIRGRTSIPPLNQAGRLVFGMAPFDQDFRRLGGIKGVISPTWEYNYFGVFLYKRCSHVVKQNNFISSKHTWGGLNRF